MSLNEADTRAQLIDPKLNVAGWTRSQVTREHFYKVDWAFTDGKIILRGNKPERQKPRRVDYLLRYTDGFPIAVVEAKDEGKEAVAGLDQAKGYARDLGLAFAYATNGHEILEWDAFTDHSQEVDRFPSPDDLWQRWQLNTGLQHVVGEKISELRPVYRADQAKLRRQNPLLHPYASGEVTRGKEPRYFQEAAIKEVLLRMMRGQKRILLTMATGTGKTFTAFQLAWKLLRSGWLGTQQNRLGRILFLADRVVLRDQAYNAFGPFASGTSDPRFLMDGQRKLSLNRDLYFGIYHNLWVEDPSGRREFEKFPTDFFDLIIIDEAHRSGFGTWRAILDHFDSAIHLGMTATPKQDENIDTYGYFCAEEPLQPPQQADHDGEEIQLPAYRYSLGQGIEDGFLATYKVHRIRTNVDKEGLKVEEALEKGAEVFVPEDAELRNDYFTQQFEREIRLPDRTATLVNHLCRLMRRFGPMQKTIVFCVDINHAREVARLLNNEFEGEFGADYAVPIVSEEGEQGRRRLAQFQDSDKAFPVVATTAELLSTGVDAPAVRNVVFMKTLNSPILFKQIMGRGTRLDPDTDKFWFRIIDYTGASRLLDPRWDKPPSPPALPSGEEETASLRGTVRLAETGDLLVGANIAVQAGPNDQRGPILTDGNGIYRFDNLPVGEVTVLASGPKLLSRQLKVTTEPHLETVCDIELKQKVEGSSGKITMKGLDVTIADEATFMVQGMDEPISLERYLDYTKDKVIGYAPDWNRLRSIWQDSYQREIFINQLEQLSIHIDVLADVLDEAEVDQFDLLAHLAYERPLQQRSDRAHAFRRREEPWLAEQGNLVQEVLLALIDKYEIGGLAQMTDPRVFRISPFREMGEVRGVIDRFGGDAQALRNRIEELQRRLYAA